MSNYTINAAGQVFTAKGTRVTSPAVIAKVQRITGNTNVKKDMATEVLNEELMDTIELQVRRAARGMMSVEDVTLEIILAIGDSVAAAVADAAASDLCQRCVNGVDHNDCD